MKGSLQTLTQYQKTHVMDQETVLQLGVDICQYLKRGVPHGEIRSSGILVSEDGEFILRCLRAGHADVPAAECGASSFHAAVRPAGI